MTGHELAEHVLVTFFLSYVRMRVRMQVDSCFRVRSPSSDDSSSPAPLWDPCSLVGSQALLFTVH